MVHFALHKYEHLDGLTQDYSISIANALEKLQSCTKPSIDFFCVISTDS